MNKSLDLMIRMGMVFADVERLLEDRGNNILTEMALPRKSVKSRISNIFPQIIENWCLIKYSTNNGVNGNLVNHWKSELLAHINNTSRLQIKENDAFDSRKKLLNQMIIEEDLTDVNVVDLIICAKFREEGIDISSREYGNVIIDFINNINEIVNLISLKDRNKIIKYIHNL